ncbi:small heat shock protein, chloroplastic-like [Olea europaea var. sylvestris]|uniref:small heat shock protein, chloroplastic-like n=1 Tax=Olea europaea var. sylvestris TaxID=158386 RepID=UPI000C1CD142|nr:small heat shock protein, chloroplastic-like [Olea europaea var. sylvestris]
MAYSLALRRAVGGAPLFSRFLFPGRVCSVAPSVRRSYNTNTQMTTYDEDDRRVDVDRRSDSSVARRRDDFPTFFSDAFDPFFPGRSLNQVLNMMDQFMDIPFMPAGRGMGIGAGVRRGWDVKEDDDALYLRLDMPGLDKDQVKVLVEQNTLVIKGEGEKESENDERGRRYSSRLDLPPNLYKLDGIKAEMKNGVLKVMVPKVKEEERKDVFLVDIK